MDVNELLGKLRTDPAFATKYGRVKSIDELQAQLKSDGYDLSTDEIKAGLNQLRAKAGELSDSELAGVTGGADGGDTVGFYKKTCPKCGRPTRTEWVDLGMYWYCDACGARGATIMPDWTNK